MKLDEVRWTCEAEIRCRIAIAKDAFNKKRELLTKKLSQNLKKKVIKTIVWSTALYGAEAWALKEQDRKRLEAFEMWCWRNMEKISWRNHTTNEDVLNLVGEKRKILKVILARKKRWIGHILRGEGLVKDVMEGRTFGKKGRGRPRIMLLDDLKKDDSYQAMKSKARDRSLWRQHIYD